MEAATRRRFLSAALAKKEGSPTLTPTVRRVVVTARFDGRYKRTRQHFDFKTVRSSRRDQLPELADLARLEAFRLVGQRSKFGVDIPGFAHAITPSKSVAVEQEHTL